MTRLRSGHGLRRPPAANERPITGHTVPPSGTGRSPNAQHQPPPTRLGGLGRSPVRSRRNPVLIRGGSCGWLRTRPEIVLPDTAFTDPPPARRLQIAYTWAGAGTRISSRGFPPWSTERVPGTSRASQILSILIRASRAQIATDVSPAGRPAAYLANSVIREQTAGRHVGDSKPHDLDAGVLRCLSSPVVTCHMPIRNSRCCGTRPAPGGRSGPSGPRPGRAGP